MNIEPTIRPGIASNHELPGRFVPGIHMQPGESLGTKLGPGQRADLLHAGRDGDTTCSLPACLCSRCGPSKFRATVETTVG